MDSELDRWWPDLGTVAAELRRAGEPAAADALVEAVRGGATSSEILGAVGTVMREHRALRPKLSDSAARAWDAVMADVDRAFPGAKPLQWLRPKAKG